MSARKIGMLLLLLAVGGAIETSWQVHRNWQLGPDGCRVMGGRFYGPSYTFEQADQRAIGAEPQLVVKNAFGGVRVSAGAAGVVKARLRKVVFEPTEQEARAFADRIELRLSVEGSAARVETNGALLARTAAGGFEPHRAPAVPPDTVVTVKNEHGQVDLSGVRSADVVSSFDGVSVRKLAGPLKLDSRHGDVSVSDLGGALELTSRHGGVELLDLHGPATIDSQHGDLTVRRSGRLEIRQQHGAVTAEGVDGDLVVRAGHSEVKASDVRGNADVETSFAGTELTRIGGDARAKADHGAVSAEDVAGGATIETSYEAIALDRVGGATALNVHHGGVEGKGLAQGVRVRASGGDVTLDGFSGPAEVELERGNARLTPRAAVTAPLSVSVKNGEAELALPEGSHVDVQAESRRGEVHSDVSELRGTSGHDGLGHQLSGRLAGGGNAVTLRADGDVRITTQPASAIAERALAKPEIASATVSATKAPGATPAEAPLAEATARPPAAPRASRPPAEKTP